MRSVRFEKGMAMLMALVMMAIASSLAVAIWYNNQLSYARVHNLQKNYQAKHYAQGMLLWASDILREDYAQDENNHDSQLDPWLQGIQGMAVEDAILSGTLVGLNNRFNVNNVIVNGQVSEPHVNYLRRLLIELNLDVGLVDKIIDWIDADQIPRPNGAEDFIYLAKTPSYQTSSQYFKNIDEVALLDGLSRDDFLTLAPYISTLPVEATATKMNVNTMPAVMLKALDNLITPEMAVRLYQEGRANYLDLRSFYQDPTIIYAVPETVKNQFDPLISTQTIYLQASSLIQMEGSEFLHFALLKRNMAGDARVLNRSLSSYLPNPLIN